MINSALSESEARELKGEAAKQNRKIYQLAAEVELHPSYLGQMLAGKVPMPTVVAERLRRALGL